MSKGALGMLAAYWPEDTPRYAHIPLKTVTDVTISAGAQAAPEATALVIGDHSYSYAELASRITKIAGAIRARCQRGARLALALEDPLELITASFGAFEAEVLSALSTAVFDDRALSAFAPELIIGEAGGSALPAVAFNELISAEGKSVAADRISGRQSWRWPIRKGPERSYITIGVWSLLRSRSDHFL